MKRIKIIIKRLEQLASIIAIRSGLIMIIPILMIGSATLVFEFFPIPHYQSFIENVFDGKLLYFLNCIYNATFGMLSVYLTCTISYSYSQHFKIFRSNLSAPITSLVCFFILSGVRINDSMLGALGVKGVFIAILSAIFATKFLVKFMNLFQKATNGYNEDSDIEFNNSVSSIVPCLFVVAIFSIINLIATSIFDVASIFELFVEIVNAMFLHLGRSFISGLLFVIVSSILWFFGIHGSDVLESVVDSLFRPAITINTSLVAAGDAPTEIFTKQFFDIFILMGGCGTAICLLLAVVFFSKRRRNKRLTKLGAVPIAFNINELMIFGYPIIFNPTFLIPFVLTPVFAFLTTFLCMSLGIVPLTTSDVNWTSPVLLSGYMATGSINGSILQLFNICVGILIYRPFVIAYDRRSEENSKKLIIELVNMKKESESELTPISLTGLNNRYGSLSRSLVSDLKYAISTDSLDLYYQPQYDNNSKCVGAESLLRWNHPVYGMMYPPLVIQLARESELLNELEEYILKKAVRDMNIIRKETGYIEEISVNISSATLQSDDYLNLLQELISSKTISKNDICLEVTEQTALQSTQETFRRLQFIKDLGYRLAIDDFSMGHTSLTYLQGNYFDTVKLDGELIREMTTNQRSYDIIKNIVSLSSKLNFSVTAEYVETIDQMKMLENVGCVHYQGYLFSKAISCDELIKRFKSENNKY